jgi:hypothetical protein
MNDFSVFVLRGKRELDGLQVALDGVLQEWRLAWGAQEDVGISVRPAGECDGKDEFRSRAWERRCLEDGIPVWQYTGQGFGRHLERSLFLPAEKLVRAEMHVESAMALSAVECALSELFAALVSKLTGKRLGMRAAEIPRLDAQFHYGSGSVIVTVSCGTRVMHLLCPVQAVTPTAVPSKRRTTSSTIPLKTALKGLPVTLSAVIGEVELTVRHLQGLAVGDVLSLSSRIDDPLRLMGPGETTVGLAHVGTYEGRRAVVLKKISP